MNKLFDEVPRRWGTADFEQEFVWHLLRPIRDNPRLLARLRVIWECVLTLKEMEREQEEKKRREVRGDGENAS